MIKLEGTVLNVFTQQGGKDKKTGDQFAVGRKPGAGAGFTKRLADR